MSKESITTLVLYHPKRPVKCLIDALNSLKNATDMDLLVECFLQGELSPGVDLPKPESFPYKLVYYPRPCNTGMSIALTESIVRFLGMGRTWWTKLDDDIILPERGWNRLIRIMKAESKQKEYKVGCVMFGGNRVGPPERQAPLKNPRDGFMMNIRSQGLGEAPELVISRGHYALRSLGNMEYTICDFVDNGCSVFDPEVFRSGCLPDPRYFLGAVNTDFVWQMLQAGYKSAYVTKPLMDHVHRPCNPKSYRSAKMHNVNHQHQAGKLFMIKWGLEDRRLTQRKAVVDKDGIVRAG